MSFKVFCSTSICRSNWATEMVVSAKSGQHHPSKKEETIRNFVQHSSIISFVHHSIILIFIMGLGWHQPNAFEHWTSNKFWLTPCKANFYWVFSFVLLAGIYSLTAILHTSGRITKVKKYKGKKINDLTSQICRGSTKIHKRHQNHDKRNFNLNMPKTMSSSYSDSNLI